MNKSESIKELASALALAQMEVENATKNAKNPHFKNNYADLAEVLNTVRPVFSKHGLSVVQFPIYEPGIVSVETILTHKSGEFLSNVSGCRVTKDDAQGVGSCITYLRRYSLAAVAGIAQEDDDATAAVQKPRVEPVKASIEPLDVAKACGAILSAPTQEKAQHYAEAAMKRTNTPEERALINQAIESFKEAA